MTLWQDSQWFKHVNELFFHDLLVPAYVEIHLLPCPLGFEPSGGECNCSASLTAFVVSCSIDTLLIEKKPSTWMALKSQEYSEEENNSSTLYLTHQHCPYNYCRPGNLEKTLILNAITVVRVSYVENANLDLAYNVRKHGMWTV